MGISAKMKILIVDEQAAMRKTIKNMLSQIGFKNIHEADDGATAWPMIQEAAEADPFQLVISNWELPKMSGLDLLKNIRGADKVKSLPFLMVTSDSEQSKVLSAVQAGVSNFVVKPFSADVLEEKISKIFQG